jgi:hypothetical protein
MSRVWAVAAAVLSLVLFSVSSAFAEQLSSSLVTSRTSQPALAYSFGAGILASPSDGANRFSVSPSAPLVTGAGAFSAKEQPMLVTGFSTPASWSASVTPAVTSAGAATGDPLRWTNARSTVDTYFGTYRLQATPQVSAPRALSSFATPSGALIMNPGATR